MKISVVIPAWNGGEVLPQCLEALQQQSHPPAEIIVVDDGSSDESGHWLAEQDDQIMLLCNAESTGFVLASNRGIAHATGDLIVLLNQDTIPNPRWLETLAAASEPNVGIIGSRLLHRDGTLQQCGGAMDGAGHTPPREPTSDGNGPFDVAWVSGAALAITRSALDAIGPLDSAFAPAYYEDVEWCVRARAQGFRVVVSPEATVVHLEESRLRNDSSDFMRLYHGNRLRMVLKHWSLSALESDFLPTESAWLEGLSVGGERLVTVMHRLYLEALLTIHRLPAWRVACECEEETEALPRIAHVLASLYALFPRTPTHLAGRPMPDTMPASAAQRPPHDQGKAPTLPPLPKALTDPMPEPRPAWPPAPIETPPPAAPFPLPPAPPPTPPTPSAPPPDYVAPAEEVRWYLSQWQKTVDALEARIVPRLAAQRQQIDHALAEQQQQLGYQDALLRHELEQRIADLRQELRHADAQQHHRQLETLSNYHRRLQWLLDQQQATLSAAIVALQAAVNHALQQQHSQSVQQLAALRSETDEQLAASLRAMQSAMGDLLAFGLEEGNRQRDRVAEVYSTYLSEQAYAITELAREIADLRAERERDRE
ncbi:MAG: glycosyltransferase [Anaerolineales bacterium]|nr:glycosyltransferase [Anaerolineales bacterium]MCB9128844.1 glycosyltransferase [Ardenticatenales bacterium]MCB9171411.1 glycosyltransferase [Ardenticatenales bacterium]